MRSAIFCLLVLASSTAAAQDFPHGRDPRVLVRTHGVVPRAWSAIVVHHSATANGNAASMDAYHRDVRHMPRGLAYHFVIDRDGEIEVGPRWTQQQPGAHVASSLRDPGTRSIWDEVAIGIVLVGNFEETSPTPQQRATLAQLIDVLSRRFRIDRARIFGHGELEGTHTACPGRALRAIVRRTREPS